MLLENNKAIAKRTKRLTLENYTLSRVSLPDFMEILTCLKIIFA